MANDTAGISIDDVRDSVRRVQSEGERLVTQIRDETERVLDQVRKQTEQVIDRIRTETSKWTGQEVPSSFADVRKQAEEFVDELRSRRESLEADVRERAQTVAGQVTRTLGFADAKRVNDLSRDITGITLRLAEIERQVSALAKPKPKKKKEENAA